MRLYPPEVYSIVRNAVNSSPNAEDAITEAVRKISELPDYYEFVEMLINRAISELVYDERHNQNRTIKKRNGNYYTEQRTRMGKSKASKRADRNFCDYYGYKIAGTELGNLTGSDLETVEQNEIALGKGHFKNAWIIKEIRSTELIESTKTIRQCMKPKQLAAIFDKIDAEFNRMKETEVV